MTRRLAAVAGIAAAFRLYIHFLSPVIPADAAAYLSSAEEMIREGLVAGMNLWNLHPLFPFLTSVVGRLGGDLALWATLISVAASAAAVFPLHALFRLWWDERTSLAAVFVFAVHPIIAPETGEPLPTALQLLCFVGALAAGLRALDGGPFWLYPASGACAGLAYLSRTEGLLAGLLLLATAVAAFSKRGVDRRRIALGAAAALVAGAALATPYVAYLSKKAGRFAITAKGGGTVLLNAVKGGPLKLEDDIAHFPFARTVWRKLSYAFFAPLLPFLAAGLYLERKEAKRRIAPLLLALAPLGPPILLFALNPHYRPSHRYFLVSSSLFLPWTAAGLLKLFDASRARRVPAVVGGGLLLALLVGKNVMPNHPEQRGFRDAGLWLAERPPGPRPWFLVSSSDKLSWYAGARHVSMDSQDPEDVLARCRSFNASLIAIDDKSLSPGLLEGLERLGCAVVREFPGDPRRVGVRVLRPPPP